MNTLSVIEQFMFDEEFFSFGAMLADTEKNKIILAKGGEISSQQKEEQTYFFAKDFYTDTFNYYYPETFIEVPLSEVISYFERFKSHPEIIETINFDHLYETDFDSFKENLDTLEKVVLISREEFRTKDFKASLKHFFYSALNFGTGHPYGFWNKTHGILGATPELLFEVKGDELFTFALAGTAKREDGEFLLTSTKDRHEHNIVIDDIKEKLTPFCSDIQVGETHLHPFKHLVHLKTDFSAKFNDFKNFIALTQKMSPTAALGGYPMNECMNFLRQTRYAKRFPHRIFGSTMGLVKPQEVITLVMIRNLQWAHDQFIIESGGGVVKESILENELNEIELKRNIIKKNYL